MTPRVLIADQLSPAAVQIFQSRGVQVDVKTGLTKAELLEIIDQYDGLAVRSATKADKDVIAAAKRLKVVGRAGIGVDNIDIPSATAAGVVVMNTNYLPPIFRPRLASGKRTGSWVLSSMARR